MRGFISVKWSALGLTGMAALVVGCGGGGDTSSDALFGDCPRIDPSPRTLSDDQYAETCGTDCDPIFALQMNEALTRASESFFVACAPKEVPLPTSYPHVLRGCLNGARDGHAYYFPSPRYRARMLTLGWERCAVADYTIDADYARCGDPLGVEPLEPEVIGEDDYGCPVVTPVPCTRPLFEYREVCGPNCNPAEMLETNQDATPWFAGCVRGGTACPDVEFDIFWCAESSSLERAFEFDIDDCDTPNQAACMMPCDADMPFGPPPNFCQEVGAGGTSGNQGNECETPADCGYDTVDMVRFCNNGWCGHGDNPWGLCPHSLPCAEDEFCYFDPYLSDPPEDGGLCVPNRCAIGGDCVRDNGGVIYIETDPVEFCKGACEFSAGPEEYQNCLDACTETGAVSTQLPLHP